MKNIRPSFRDKKLEAQFQKDGFVKVPFLNENEVAQLKEAYINSINEKQGVAEHENVSEASTPDITYDFTFIDSNVAYKKKVFNIITKVFERHADRYLDDYKPIIANYIFKEKGAGEVPMHQNWAFVEERKCTSISIWCPLIDSNLENGTLQLVKGSHKRFSQYRGPMVQSEFSTIHNEIINSDYMKAIDTKAGEAIMLDDSVIHYSTPNKTDDYRLAIQLILIPKEETLVFYHRDLAKNNEEIVALEIDQSFLLHFDPWKQPSKDLKRLSTYKFSPSNLSFDEFEKRLSQPRFDDTSFKAKWFRLKNKCLNKFQQ